MYMLYAAALKKAVPNFGPDRVCLALKEAGALITQSDGRNQKVVSIPNKGKARMYNIDYEKVQKALEEK
jgi:predicted transcriptional regulator